MSYYDINVTSRHSCHITTFMSYFRYLPSDHPWRSIRSGSRIGHDLLQYSAVENRCPPRKRSYQKYICDGTEAERTGKSVNGVKGVWVLHCLPYAKDIHWTVDMMHTFANVIQDTLNSMRPSNSGGPHLYKHVNRTYCEGVVHGSRNENTFESPFDELDGTRLPNWCLTKKECIDVDRRMNYIIGRYDSDDMPKNIMRAGKGKKSHDTITWATTYAAWCLRGHGEYVDHNIELFEMIGRYNASYISREVVKGPLYDDFVKCLVKREGMMPASEATMTFHELFHIVNQMKEVGCPRHSTLYKFEKMNKVLKRNLKNTAKGVVYMSYCDIYVTCDIYVVIRH